LAHHYRLTLLDVTQFLPRFANRVGNPWTRTSSILIEALLIRRCGRAVAAPMLVVSVAAIMPNDRCSPCVVTGSSAVIGVRLG
jgi:hypothetical protein